MIKKTSGSGTDGGVKQNKQLAEELHKPIIKKIKRRRVDSLFKDNIWGVDLADVQLISKFDKGIRFLLCVVDLFSKYACVIPLKDRKGVIIVNAFQSILNYSILIQYFNISANAQTFLENWQY